MKENSWLEFWFKNCKRLSGCFNEIEFVGGGVLITKLNFSAALVDDAALFEKNMWG